MPLYLREPPPCGESSHLAQYSKVLDRSGDARQSSHLTLLHTDHARVATQPSPVAEWNLPVRATTKSSGDPFSGSSGCHRMPSILWSRSTLKVESAGAAACTFVIHAPFGRQAEGFSSSRTFRPNASGVNGFSKNGNATSLPFSCAAISAV